MIANHEEDNHTKLMKFRNKLKMGLMKLFKDYNAIIRLGV
jgi:hypothetical protein